MRIITPATNSEWPKRHTCLQCKAELEYEKDDVYVGVHGLEYIECLNCGTENVVNEKRIAPPDWPMTFEAQGGEGCVNNNSITVQKLIDNVVNELESGTIKPGEFYSMEQSGILVAGFRFEDEYEIIVTGDYWIDYTESDFVERDYNND